MSEVFSILLHNRQRYEQGKEGLWFSLPTTTEKLQEALREIGISADNPQDFFLYDYRSPQERPIKLPRDLVLSADVDELNFLAARLEKLDAAELAELLLKAILLGEHYFLEHDVLKKACRHILIQRARIRGKLLTVGQPRVDEPVK